MSGARFSDLPLAAGFAVVVFAASAFAQPGYQRMHSSSPAPIMSAAPTTPQCVDSNGVGVACNGATMLQIAYFGGKVIPNAKVYAVFWTSSVNAQTKSEIGGLYQALTNSAWIDWLTDYSTTGISGGSNQVIGRGTYAGSFTIVPITSAHTCVGGSRPGATCIWDANIPTELETQISAGHLPQPDPHTIYMIHFPSTFVIQSLDRSSINDSCVQYCAYHSTYSRPGTGSSVYFGVLPDFGFNGCQSGCGTGSVFNNLSSAASHELGEAITDAEVGVATAPNAPPLGWYDGGSISQGEIGDMCNQATDTLTSLANSTTYTVQQLFSKVIWDALPLVSTPACVSRRFDPDDYAIYFNPNVQTVAVGGNVSIPIHVDTTNGSASLVTLAQSTMSTLSAGVHATPSLINVTSALAGAPAVSDLNITVDTGTAPAGDEVVVVSATSELRVHSASVLLQIVPATPAASSNSPVCAGTAINLSTPTVTGAVYSWTGPNSFTSIAQNPTISNAAVVNAGIYSVTVTVNHQTSAAGTTTVTVNPVPATPAITSPQNVVAGATGLNASVVLHTNSTYAWAITNGTITSATTGNQITFTAGTSGNVSLSVIETNVGCASSQATASIPIVGPPQNIVASALSGTSVHVSWLPNGGSPNYEILRRDNGAGFAVIGMTTALSYSDGTASANTWYLYTVRAVDSVTNRSPNGNFDLATTVVFTDDPPIELVTAIKATHIIELRIAVNAVRKLAGLSQSTFTDLSLDATVKIKAVHVSEIRAALDEARTALMLPAVTYTDATLASGATVVQAIHVRELRDGMK